MNVNQAFATAQDLRLLKQKDQVFTPEQGIRYYSAMLTIGNPSFSQDYATRLLLFRCSALCEP